ncbi:hypothetical protein Busp01_35930 [Trinickia caryophylli]|uniref:Lipoprotein n=1 Tax=Trinickia caryophylli TaxID=28094 RepID=A0A1X7GH00_TRICW|nr:hypothetical protein C0Z17_28515 [Trinickia caryophylli]GLU33751.1 hypothetical protein Busp01_35930 [Trinickia caryophylli]SMF69215.1 hypothetical protein SAMN06295900_115145 [Trinickia caryophylli]
MKGNHVLFIAALTTVLAACISTSDVVEVGKDTYSVSATSDGMRAASSGRQSAFAAGNEKCASMGKHFQLVTEDSRRTRMGIDTTSDVTFRCLDANDPAYTRPNIQPAPTAIIENRTVQQ